ncbi:MAG: FMN-binding protein [Oscillatoriaceae cyanobacterium Prado104]|jgi:uncharacterized protein with FMN-binding domain|nr:FMN-binding protein [Oscillatoriaceae cyanobacterium Prado104]
MFNPTTRRILLSIHILLATIWVGGLVAMLLLVHAKAGIQNGDELAAIDRTIFYIHDYAVTNAMFGFLYTGLCFSLFTNWGAFKFHWIALKWAIIFFFGFFITAISTPAINSMAAISDALRLDALSDPAYLQAVSNTIRWTWLELAILISVVVISVFKPWGTRKKPLQINRKATLVIGAVVAIAVALYLYQQNVVLQSYRRQPVAPVNLATVADGTYRGEETGGGFTYAVDVTVAQHQITRIDIISNRSALYPLLAEGVTRKVIRAQKVDLDGVTGATTTSKSLLLAIEDALQKAVKK